MIDFQLIKQRVHHYSTIIGQPFRSLIERLSNFIAGNTGRWIIRICLFIITTSITFIVFSYLLLYVIPDFESENHHKNVKYVALLSKSDSVILKKQLVINEKKIGKLNRQLSRLVPKSPYIVINTTKNEFYLYKNQTLMHQGKCSTGSYVLLLDDNKHWMFKTPKGEFFIQGKTTAPIWKKPDWAFIEDGLPIPSPNAPARYEYGVLGDYALSLGHGYLIHGTLYQRFLGLPVTHGCIRLGDDDLEIVYQTLNLGSKVFIY